MFLPLLLPRSDESTGDITIPHTAILSALQRHYIIEEVESGIGGSGNAVKPGSGGKRFPSTLAGGNTADNTFAIGKRPMSTLSTLGAFAHRRLAGSTVFRLGPPRMVKPAGAIAFSWGRLFARLPHKV